MPRVSKQKMDEICDLIMQGNPIKGICKGSDMPSYMTFLRHVQEDEDAHALYERARAIQCEVMHDEILDMVTAPLPDDKQLANAEVQRRRLEADVKDKSQSVGLVAICFLRVRVDDPGYLVTVWWCH